MAEILVVVDDPVMKMTPRALLEQAGNRGVVADDGGAGRATFQTGRFYLVFLGIFTPAMDGLQTMSLVRQLQPAIPIIATSGRPETLNADSELNLLAMTIQLSAVRSLPKPFKPTTLLAAVAACNAVTKLSPTDRDVASCR
jgi:CheY-like chemotaxis protein